MLGFCRTSGPPGKPGSRIERAPGGLSCSRRPGEERVDSMGGFPHRYRRVGQARSSPLLRRASSPRRRPRPRPRLRPAIAHAYAHAIVTAPAPPSPSPSPTSPPSRGKRAGPGPQGPEEEEESTRRTKLMPQQGGPGRMEGGWGGGPFPNAPPPRLRKSSRRQPRFCNSVELTPPDRQAARSWAETC